VVVGLAVAAAAPLSSDSSPSILRIRVSSPLGQKTQRPFVGVVVWWSLNGPFAGIFLLQSYITLTNLTCTHPRVQMGLSCMQMGRCGFHVKPPKMRPHDHTSGVWQPGPYCPFSEFFLSRFYNRLATLTCTHPRVHPVQRALAEASAESDKGRELTKITKRKSYSTDKRTAFVFAV
jgi:hypothetical protein